MASSNNPSSVGADAGAITADVGRLLALLAFFLLLTPLPGLATIDAVLPYTPFAALVVPDVAAPFFFVAVDDNDLLADLLLLLDSVRARKTKMIKIG